MSLQQAAHPRAVRAGRQAPPRKVVPGTEKTPLSTSDGTRALTSSLSPLQSPLYTAPTRQRLQAATAYSDAYSSPPSAYRDNYRSPTYHKGGWRMADTTVALELEDAATPSSWVTAAGKHLLRRLTRAAKTANWPLVIAFCSCVIILFRALSGAGYVPPDSITATPSISDSLLDRLGLPDNIPNRGWTHAWDVWRQVAEDLRNQIMEDREKWVGSVRPERERGRWAKGFDGPSAMEELMAEHHNEPGLGELPGDVVLEETQRDDDEEISLGSKEEAHELESDRQEEEILLGPEEEADDLESDRQEDEDTVLQRHTPGNEEVLSGEGETHQA